MLEDKITAILEGIEVKEDDGLLFLHSQPLEEVQKPYQNSRLPVIGTVVDAVIKSFRESKEEELQHLIAQRLDAYLTRKIAESDSSQKREQFDRLKMAFGDFHDIKINHLDVNYNHVNRLGFFARNLEWSVALGIIAAQSFIPGLDFSNYLVVPAIFGAALCSFKLRNRQKVNFPVPSLSEIETDIDLLIEKLEEKIDTPKARNTYSFFGYELEELLPSLPKEAAVQLREIVTEQGEMVQLTVDFEGTSPYNPALIPEMKEAVDKYAQKYCPTFDLAEVKIKVKKMFPGKGGGIGFGKEKVVEISRQILEADMNNFDEIYAHELAHLNGVDSEGMAQYQAMQIVSDMEQAYPHQGHEFTYYQTLLAAAAHTYVLERKESLRPGMNGIKHFGDVISYNTRKAISFVLRREPPSVLSVGVNRVIYDELVGHVVGHGLPETNVNKFFEDFENLSLTKMFISGLQHFLKNDDFRGGYTKDLYRLMKQKGKI